MSAGRSLFALPLVLLLLCGAVLPLAILVVISFWSVDFDAFELVPGFGLASWREVLGQPDLPLPDRQGRDHGAGDGRADDARRLPDRAVARAVPTRWKSVALVVLLTPLYTGEIVRIYAWRLVLGTDGLVNGLLLGLHLVQAPVKIILFSPFSTILALFYDELPFMTLALWIAAERLDLRLVEAARDLGARPLAAFFRVTLPLTSHRASAPALSRSSRSRPATCRRRTSSAAPRARRPSPRSTISSARPSTGRPPRRSPSRCSSPSRRLRRCSRRDPAHRRRRPPGLRP